MKVLFINPPLANHTHGTGKQLQYLARSLGEGCHQLCWARGDLVGDEPCPVTNLYEDVLDHWPWIVGRGFFRRIQRRFRLLWWDDGRLSGRSVSRVRQLRQKGFGAAYVIVASEEDAKIAGACLDLLKLPYVVNWMDLMEMEELSPAQHPHITRLCRNAMQVYALTGALQRAINSCSTIDRTRKLGIARRPTQKRCLPPNVTSPIRCVMLGTLAYGSLHQVWPEVLNQIQKSGMSFELFYIGPKEKSRQIPSDLQVTVLEALSDDERDEVLSRMHVALLPGPDTDPKNEWGARYSFPSRIADFLHHGLPVVGSVHPDSATAEELRSLIGKAVWLSNDATELVEAIMHLAVDTAKWKLASELALEFATRHFAMDALGTELSGSLAAAAHEAKLSIPQTNSKRASAASGTI